MAGTQRATWLALIFWFAGFYPVGSFAEPRNGTLVSMTEIHIRAAAETLNHPALSRKNLADHVRVFEIRYRSDGMSISACLIEPAVPGIYPAVIYNHGGNRDFGALTMDLDMLMDLEMLQLADLAARGFVVVASQYRGVAGNPGRDEFGGADVRDVLNLIPLLESRDNVNSERIGMIGHSRGGMMTYLALTQTTRIKAAVVLAGPADLLALGKERPAMYQVFREVIGDGDSERLRADLIDRSAFYWADRLPVTTPLLLVHGTVDRRVNPSESLRMADQLADAGIPFQLVLVEGLGHSWHTVEVVAHVYRWFDRFLKSGG